MGLYDNLTWDKPNLASDGLNDAEKKLALCVQDGKPCDLSGGKDFDVKDPKAWDGQREKAEIRGEVIAALAIRELRGEDKNKITPTHNGVMLRGACILSDIDLSNAIIPYPIHIAECLVKGIVDIAHADLHRVILSGCRIEGSEGGIDEKTQRLALRGDGARVKSALFLRDSFWNGEVRLLGADVGGELSCDGATFENKSGDAFCADRLKTGGSVFLKITAKGETRLLSADIGSNLSCKGATFENETGIAFNADGLKIRGNVNFKITAKGETRLLGADIGGQLTCRGARFENANRPAFNAQGAKVKAGFFWNGDEPIAQGVVDLRHMHVGVLADSLAAWHSGSPVLLDGFEYDAIAPDANMTIMPVNQRFEWFSLMPAVAHTPQPYRQLAKVLHEMGHETDARKVSIARMDAYRKHGRLGRLHRGWLTFIERTAGYGYEPWRVLHFIALILFVSTFVFSDGYGYGSFHPTKERIYIDLCYIKSAGNSCKNWQDFPRNWTDPARLPKDYPEFNSVVYTLDVFFPFVDLHQEDHWEPASHTFRDWVIRVWMWLTIAAGWILSTIGIAAFTGIVKDKDD